MSEQEQAEHLLATVRHRLSGREIEHMEAIIELDGEEPPEWFDLKELKREADDAQEEFENACSEMNVDPDDPSEWPSTPQNFDEAKRTLTRLCTEFAEIFK